MAGTLARTYNITLTRNNTLAKKGKVLVSEKQGGMWTTCKVHNSVKYGRKEFSAFSRENED